jgi:hypothetical protein
MDCENSTHRYPLRYVACMSYPRSGHHLTVRLLAGYFGEQFRYCQFYDRPAGCCGQFPCTARDVNLTKNHDMDLGQTLGLGLPKLRELPYLVLVRNFLDAAVSDYNLYLREHEDSLETWQSFAQRKLGYYQRFVRKWILLDDDVEKLVVRYEDLTSRPEEWMGRIVGYFAPGEPIVLERIRELVSDALLEDVRPRETTMLYHFGVRNRRRIEDFHHYDPVFFSRLESQLWPELRELGYQPRYAA